MCDDDDNGEGLAKSDYDNGDGDGDGDGDGEDPAESDYGEKQGKIPTWGEESVLKRPHYWSLLVVKWSSAGSKR